MWLGAENGDRKWQEVIRKVNREERKSAEMMRMRAVDSGDAGLGNRKKTTRNGYLNAMRFALQDER